MFKKGLTLNSLTAFLLTLAVAGLFLYSSAWIQTIERPVYDWMLRVTASERKTEPQIVLVEIDDKSIESLGSWPWPRSKIAAMLDRLKESGVKVIGLNLAFYERQSSPELRAAQSLRTRMDALAMGTADTGVMSAIQEAVLEIEATLDEDRVLIEGVRRAGNVVFPVFPALPADQKPPPGNEGSLVSGGGLDGRGSPLSMRRDFRVENLYFPFGELAQAALGFGHGADSLLGFGKGISNMAVVVFQDSLIPSFPLRIAAAYLGLSPGEILVGETDIQMQDYSVPLWKGHLLMRFQRGAEAFPRHGFADLMQRQELPSFQGKIALIGFHLKGGPAVKTPLRASVCETHFQALVLDSILNRTLVYRPRYLAYAEPLMILLFGAFGALFFPRMGASARLGCTAGLAAIALGVPALLLFRFDVWVQGTSAAVAVVSICLLTSIWQRIVSLQATKNSAETNRLLGLSFQSQGLLDIAFEKFRKLPLDGETKDLIYNLALEYEQKKLFAKAVSVYEYLLREGPFRDVGSRIPKLQEADKSSTLGSHVKLTTASILNAAPMESIKKIGRYDILEIIGKGSMGLVYKALDPKINRLLAIKTIRFSDEFDEDVIQEIKERFFREAEIAGQLSHPSIVTIHDLGEDQDLTYMAMEYLEGDDLEKFISKKNLLPLRKVLHVVASVAEALDFAHHADVIHRDIKPANIRLLRSGGVKVTDFGIARAISSSRTRTGVILGTPNYMSPEQIMGQKIDPRSDIFSLGVLLYQLLTGELPFQGDNLSSLLYQITQVKQPPLRTFNPKIPLACGQIIDKALAKNPNERFKTAGQMARVLRLLALKIEQRQKKQAVGAVYSQSQRG